jgi:hypothetical protein
VASIKADHAYGCSPYHKKTEKIKAYNVPVFLLFLDFEKHMTE